MSQAGTTLAAAAAAHKAGHERPVAVFEDLLAAVGDARDGTAFTHLFAHFGPRLQTQMIRLGLGPFAAADVTQDVMETIWRKAHLFDRRKSAAATWIYHIARNRRIDMRRRSRELPCPVQDFFVIPDPGAATDERIDAAQRQRCVHAALGVLPREQLALVKLAFYEGLSHSAIAQRTRLPLGTVKSRLRLAFSQLRRFLQDAGVTEA